MGTVPGIFSYSSLKGGESVYFVIAKKAAESSCMFKTCFISPGEVAGDPLKATYVSALLLIWSFI